LGHKKRLDLRISLIIRSQTLHHTNLALEIVIQLLETSRHLLRSIPVRKIAGLTLLLSMLGFSAVAQNQNSSSQPSDATAILAQIGSAFSAGKSVSRIQLSGNAKWYAGGAEDSGSATLTAAASGAAQMQLSLTEKGVWTESEDDFGTGMICRWATADGIAHMGDAMNCLKPTVWFLPSLFLQPGSIPAGVGVLDLGLDAVSSGNYRHLRSQAVLSDMPEQLLSGSVDASTTDIGFDVSTLLPAVLRYRVHPDNGAPVNIQIEIRYSDYRKIDGVQIPFLVQRYINGSLQLAIEVTSAQIS